jgi:lysophospholipase L1-like esterase
MGLTEAPGLNKFIADQRYLKTPGPAVIGAIGASITSNGTLSYYDRALSGLLVYGSIHPMGQGLLKTRGRFIAGGIAATNGYTTTQMIATHLPQVLASNWNYCLVGEVTNDLGNGFTLATTKSNITTIILALLKKNIIPILTTVPPNDSYASGAGLTWILQYNRWIKNQARILGIPIVDYHRALVNASTNAYITGYTADGTHPTANGANLMGIALAECLNSIPGPERTPLESSYNPNLAIPDVCATSAGSDKIVGGGSSLGGWTYVPQTSEFWKGNSPTVMRGTSGDYAVTYPVSAGAIIAGHRMRLSFGIQAFCIVGSGTWGGYLYNTTESKALAGFQAVTHPLHDGSMTCQLDGACTSGQNTVTCATSKPFKPNMIGNPIAAGNGVNTRFPLGTKIINVSPTGDIAYCDQVANANVTAQCVMVWGKPQVAVFEFDAQSDMLGDSISFYANAGSATQTMVAPSQITLEDLTALGVV